jgi:hypothetical protein
MPFANRSFVERTKFQREQAASFPGEDYRTPSNVLSRRTQATRRGRRVSSGQQIADPG